jgi:D-sedoheptulose 7-phosphate isomerase
MLAAARNIAAAIIAALLGGNKLLVIGNGGSAGDAQHIAAEIVGRYKKNRPGYAAIALTTDTSALTAITNDYGFEQVFARQVEGLGVRGDVLLALSTSGRSPNILAALRTARARGLVTIGFTGAKAAMGADCDHLLIAPTEEPVQRSISPSATASATSRPMREAAPKWRRRSARMGGPAAFLDRDGVSTMTTAIWARGSAFAGCRTRQKRSAA